MADALSWIVIRDDLNRIPGRPNRLFFHDGAGCPSLEYLT
jgi:hypothetical protein